MPTLQKLTSFSLRLRAFARNIFVSLLIANFAHQLTSLNSTICNPDLLFQTKNQQVSYFFYSLSNTRLNYLVLYLTKLVGIK